MAIVRVDRTVQTGQGQAIAGAKFYILTQPADIGDLSPLATVYGDLAGTPVSNPRISDGLGQVAFYLDNTQLYTFVVVSPLINEQSYADQSLGSSSGGVNFTPAGEVPAGAIDGTNRIFTLGHAPVAGTLLYQLNGQTLTKDLGYTVAGNIVTMATAPQPGTPGDTLYANYFF